MNSTIKSKNCVKICNIISAVLLLSLLVCQMMPFWQVDDHGVSIQGYVWFPEDHTEILDYFKAEANPMTTVNDIVLMPIIVIISGILGIFLCISKSDNVWCACLPGICAIAGIVGYLCVPAFRLGSFWVFHLILCFAVLAIAVATVICWVKNKKYV